MRIVSFRPLDSGAGRQVRVGALVGDGREVLDLRIATSLTEDDAKVPPAPPERLQWFNLDGPWYGAARRALDEFEAARLDLRKAGAILPLDQVRLLAPVPRPGKVICIGLNYRDHAAESRMAVPERPVLFSKFPSCIIGPDEPIVLPAGSEKVDYEAELAVVVGRVARRVPRERALDHVLGYTNFHDVSARDFQFSDGQWQRGKSCDTFGPMGPWLATSDEIPDPHALRIQFRLNGEPLQDSSTAQLVFGVPDLIAFISASITLEPGDVIATGTPAGVGFARRPPVYLKAGDVCEVEIQGLGVLRNPVQALGD